MVTEATSTANSGTS
ncbi:hypothetical protein LINPERPRIM_LOCUS25766 [Linum perenne]